MARWVDHPIDRTVFLHSRVSNQSRGRIKAKVSGKIDMIVPLVATNCARFETRGPRPERDIRTNVESNQFPAGPAQDAPVCPLLTHKPFAFLCRMRVTLIVRFKCGSSRPQRSGYAERWDSFLATGAASSFPLVRTDSVSRGRFIILVILAINFSPLLEFFAFIIRTYASGLRRSAPYRPLISQKPSSQACSAPARH